MVLYGESQVVIAQPSSVCSANVVHFSCIFFVQ